MVQAVPQLWLGPRNFSRIAIAPAAMLSSILMGEETCEFKPLGRCNGGALASFLNLTRTFVRYFLSCTDCNLFLRVVLYQRLLTYISLSRNGICCRKVTSKSVLIGNIPGIKTTGDRATNRATIL